MKKQITKSIAKLWHMKKPGEKLIYKKPWADTDRDGVLNIFDCQPLNPKKQEVYKWDKVKRSVSKDKNNLYHKTELSYAKQILKTNKLKPSASGQFSMSEHHNPHVVYKSYKQPVVLVLDKKKLPDVKKIDYKEGHHLKFESEKEWISSGGPARGVVKGIIVNEKASPKTLKGSEVGLTRSVHQSLPTRYITEKDMYKIKYKGDEENDKI
jgi:hypothetical protein